MGSHMRLITIFYVNTIRYKTCDTWLTFGKVTLKTHCNKTLLMRVLGNVTFKAQCCNSLLSRLFGKVSLKAR